MVVAISGKAFRLEISLTQVSGMAKLSKEFDLPDLLSNIGGFALLLLVITLGALIPIKAIELVSGRPILDELIDFAREPSIDVEDVKTRSSNP